MVKILLPVVRWSAKSNVAFPTSSTGELQTLHPTDRIRRVLLDILDKRVGDYRPLDGGLTVASGSDGVLVSFIMVIHCSARSIILRTHGYCVDKDTDAEDQSSKGYVGGRLS